MIELQHVSKTFDTKQGQVHSLKDINLTISPGEIFGIIGHSGAGKSTLLRCVNLLERPTVGKVFVNQKELTALSPIQLIHARRDIGMIFQHFNLLSSKSVLDNVTLPLKIAGLNEANQKEHIYHILNSVGLTNKQDVFPNQLSGGQKQRAALARALATKPSVLLCDEATSALDPQTTDSILQLLKSLNHEFNLTILLITHEMEVIKKIADRVAIMDQGEIIEQGKTSDIFFSPQQLITQKFVSAGLKQKLPLMLADKISPNRDNDHLHLVLRIVFRAHTAAEPLITQLARTFNIDLNILQANIEFLQNDSFGSMLVEVVSQDETLEKIINYLTDKGLKVEKIGYVLANII